MQQKDSTAVNAVSVVLETRSKMHQDSDNPFFLHCATKMLFFWVFSDLTTTYSCPLERNVFVLAKNNYLKDADLYTEFSKWGNSRNS